MNLRQVFLATFVLSCLVFGALASLYQTADLEQDSKTPVLQVTSIDAVIKASRTMSTTEHLKI